MACNSNWWNPVEKGRTPGVLSFYPAVRTWSPIHRKQLEIKTWSPYIPYWRKKSQHFPYLPTKAQRPVFPGWSRCGPSYPASCMWGIRSWHIDISHYVCYISGWPMGEWAWPTSGSFLNTLFIPLSVVSWSCLGTFPHSIMAQFTNVHSPRDQNPQFWMAQKSWGNPSATHGKTTTILNSLKLGISGKSPSHTLLKRCQCRKLQDASCWKFSFQCILLAK